MNKIPSSCQPYSSNASVHPHYQTYICQNCICKSMKDQEANNDSICDLFVQLAIILSAFAKQWTLLIFTELQLLIESVNKYLFITLVFIKIFSIQIMSYRVTIVISIRNHNYKRTTFTPYLYLHFKLTIVLHMWK